jgi:hypothetical protein
VGRASVPNLELPLNGDLVGLGRASVERVHLDSPGAAPAQPAGGWMDDADDPEPDPGRRGAPHYRASPGLPASGWGDPESTGDAFDSGRHQRLEGPRSGRRDEPGTAPVGAARGGASSVPDGLPRPDPPSPAAGPGMGRDSGYPRREWKPRSQPKAALLTVCLVGLAGILTLLLAGPFTGRARVLAVVGLAVVGIVGVVVVVWRRRAAR